MYCEECGRKIPDDSRFCDGCGAPVYRAPSHSGSEHGADQYYGAPMPEGMIPDKEKKSKGLTVLIAVFSLVAVVLTGVLIYIGVRTFGGKGGPEKKNAAAASESSSGEFGKAKEETNEGTKEQIVIEPSADEAEKDSSADETVAASSESETLPQTEAAEKQYSYLGNMKYPGNAADFVTESVPDGAYTFMYPKDFFSSGTYNASEKQLSFTAADGCTSFTITEIPAVIQNDSMGCSNYWLEQYESRFQEGDSTPYIHKSKGVDEIGFSRAIIGGVLKEDGSRGEYVIAASNQEKTYLLKITYYAVGGAGCGVDYTPMGYILDCIYRGWSLGGSTYQLRTYEQYMANDMGTKK